MLYNSHNMTCELWFHLVSNPNNTCKYSLFVLKGHQALTFDFYILPTDPAMRFTDLFLTRKHWKAEEIVPYLSDIAVDTKDLDKLLPCHFVAGG